MLEKQPDGIEILVDMAKTGKIEPWNIDIVDVTDKYLQQLVEMKSNNLKFTGRTLFFAAVLLRLKSDVLEGIDPLAMIDESEIAEFDETDDFFENDGFNTSNVISLEDALARRSSVRLNRQRVVTLKDLIRQLEFYEKIEKKRSLINAHERAQRRARSYADFTPDDILEMAHEEYIEEGIDNLHTILLKLFETNEKVELSELNETGMDKISVYITLLFLSAKSRIDLVQDEFYSDLYIVQGA
jgi:segregation and condensation protein A